MMAVAVDFQNKGVGAQLKWAQRKRALNEGRKFIKWTWEPMRARNAHFNLNLLGAIVEEYAENFYGTDYLSGQAEQSETAYGIDSDRLFESIHSSMRISGVVIVAVQTSVCSWIGLRGLRSRPGPAALPPVQPLTVVETRIK